MPSPAWETGSEAAAQSYHLFAKGPGEPKAQEGPLAWAWEWRVRHGRGNDAGSRISPSQPPPTLVAPLRSSPVEPVLKKPASTSG